jgi:hypothetical protein
MHWPPPPCVELPEPTRLGEVAWLEPYPDVLLEGLADAAPGPEAQYETTESICLIRQVIEARRSRSWRLTITSISTIVSAVVRSFAGA